MNKENNRSAAGLRRSAVAERIRLREEWMALKEIDSQNTQNSNTVISKKKTVKKTKPMSSIPENRYNKMPVTNVTSDILAGVVALVEVGDEMRALPLRAALTALGATVLPAWSPLVTHLIWSEGGSRSVRGRCRALAVRVVSALWVEGCAGAERRLPERAFPAPARPSDLPSPKTLTRLLKKAEMENIPIMDLLSESNDEKEQKMPRLRISSETERDTSNTTLDTSRDTTKDSNDTSADKSDETPDIESRVNTAPRRALPKVSESVSPRPPARSRRKLFTQKENMEEDDNDETQKTKSTQPKVSQRERRELVRAERLAKRLLAACTNNERAQANIKKKCFRIVLSGMSREERRVACERVRQLHGVVQREVDRWTTHVVLGDCKQGSGDSAPLRPRTVSALAGAARGCLVLQSQWLAASASANVWLHHTGYQVPHLKKIAMKARVERIALSLQRADYAYDVFYGMRVALTQDAEQRDAAIKLLKLCGAVVIENPRLQPQNEKTQNLPPSNTILTLTNILARNCLSTQNGSLSQKARELNCQTQNLTKTNRDYDLLIGVKNGELSSKWVFDSVAAARMRTTRRYVINSLSNSDVASQMLAENID